MLTAALAALAVTVGLTAMRPAPEPTRPVPVAARDLPAGHLLRADDVETVQWPARLVEQVAGEGQPTAASLAGRRVVGPVRDGEPVTTARLLTPATLPGTSAGDVVLSLPSDDAALTEMLRPGDRVDVFDQQGTPAARGVRVLAVVPAGDEAGPRAAASVLVAVPRAYVGAVASARSGGPGGTAPVVLAMDAG